MEYKQSTYWSYIFHSIADTDGFCVVFVLATNITVSASSNVEKENIFMDEVESSNVLSEATSTQILEDGVYYIRVWSSLDYLSVPNYNVNNSANVACTATRNSDWSVTNEKNQIWLLTHLGDNKYSIRPIMKPDMGLNCTSTNVNIYNIGTDYDYAPTTAIWCITYAPENSSSYVIQLGGDSNETVAYNTTTQNVYTKSYTGAPEERWNIEKLSDTDVEGLEGVMLFGPSTIRVGDTISFTAGVFSASTLDQSVTYYSTYYAISINSDGSITGNYEDVVNIRVTSAVDSTCYGVAQIAVTDYGRQDAALIGIPSDLGGTHNHEGYFNTIYSDLSSIVDGDDIATYTEIANYKIAVGLLYSSEIFVFRGHGLQNKILFGDDTLLAPYMSSANISAEANVALKDSELVLYMCCLTGQGGIYADNLVTATATEGAKNVIGFTVEIACDAANNWIADFFEELSNLAYGLEDITTDNIETVLAILSTQYPNTTVSNSNVLYMYN